MPWLRHFALFVVFVTALFRPAAAGAFVSAPDAGSQARVGAVELVAATLVGPASAATCGVHEGIGAAYDENASGYRFAAGVPRALSRILGFTERNLQKGFTKHGADFGMTGDWNPSRATDFSRAVNQHINAPGVRSITGTYRWNPVTHDVDPSTGLSVIADPAGNDVSGWRLGAAQLESVLTTGRPF